MVKLLEAGFREVMRHDQLEDRTFWLANMGKLVIVCDGYIRVVEFKQWM